MGLTHELTSLILEVLAILAAVGVLTAVLVRWGQGRPDVRLAAAGVVALFAVAFTVTNLVKSSSALDHAAHSAVGGRAGLERCVNEDRAGQRLPFVNWVKRRLPPAVFTLAPYPGHLDAWCVTLVLLPALPAGPGGTPTWTVTLGTIPPELKARIARHDPSVQVFATGFALSKERPR